MRITKKSLERRVAVIRQSFGLPNFYIHWGEHASDADKRLYGLAPWSTELNSKCALWGSQEGIGTRLTEYKTLREMDAYLDGLISGLHIARRFVGLRRPGLVIGNYWADYFFAIMNKQTEEMAQEYGVAITPDYPWKGETTIIPFGRPYI